MFVGVLAGIVLAALAWRFASRRASLPCPAWMAWLLELGEPLMNSKRTIDALQVARGMHVLDAGAGAGRVSVQLAEMVGPEGEVVAVDIQPRMLEKTLERAKRLGLSNIRTHCLRLGTGALAPDRFDRAVLVTVLGEIPEQVAALREIREALRPGGLLAVTEVFPDPHYQFRSSVVRRLEEAGFTIVEQEGPWWSHTTVGRRDEEVHAPEAAPSGDRDPNAGDAVNTA